MTVFIQADAARLPFADNTFDLVLGSPLSRGAVAGTMVHACAVHAEFVEASYALPYGMLSLDHLRTRYEFGSATLKGREGNRKAFWDLGNLFATMPTTAGAEQRALGNGLTNEVSALVAQDGRALGCSHELFGVPCRMFASIPRGQLAIVRVGFEVTKVKQRLRLGDFDLEKRQKRFGGRESRLVAYLPLEQRPRVSCTWLGGVDQASEHRPQKVRNLRRYLSQRNAR